MKNLLIIIMVLLSTSLLSSNIENYVLHQADLSDNIYLAAYGVETPKGTKVVMVYQEKSGNYKFDVLGIESGSLELKSSHNIDITFFVNDKQTVLGFSQLINVCYDVFAIDKVAFEVVFDLESPDNWNQQIAYTITEEGEVICISDNGHRLMGNIGIRESRYGGSFVTDINIFPGDGGAAINSSIKSREASMISVYPNPVSRQLNVRSNESANFELYNDVGALLQSKNKASSIDMSNYPKGVYLLNISGTTFKVLKE